MECIYLHACCNHWGNHVGIVNDTFHIAMHGGMITEYRTLTLTLISQYGKYVLCERSLKNEFFLNKSSFNPDNRLCWFVFN